MTILNNVKIINLDNTQLKHIDKTEFALSKKIGNTITPQPKKDTLLTEAALPLSYDVDVDLGYPNDKVLGGSTIKSGTLIKADSILENDYVAISDTIYNSGDTFELTSKYVITSDSIIKTQSFIKAGSKLNSTEYNTDTILSDDVNCNSGYLKAGSILADGCSVYCKYYPTEYDDETYTLITDYTTTKDFITSNYDNYDLKFGTNLAEGSTIIGTIDGTEYNLSNPFIVDSLGHVLTQHYLPNGNRLVTVQAFQNYKPKIKTFDKILSFQTDNLTTNTDIDKTKIDDTIEDKILTANNFAQSYTTDLQLSNKEWLDSNLNKLVTTNAILSDVKFMDMLLNNCYYNSNIQQIDIDWNIDYMIPLHKILTKKINNNNIDIYINDKLAFTIDNKASEINNLNIKVKTTDTVNIKAYKTIEPYNNFELKLVKCNSILSYDFGSTITDVENVNTDFARFLYSSNTEITAKKAQENGFLAKYLKIGDIYYNIDYTGQYVDMDGNIHDINNYKIGTINFESGTEKLIIGNTIEFIDNGVHIRGINNKSVSSVYYDKKVYDLTYNTSYDYYNLTYKN